MGKVDDLRKMREEKYARLVSAVKDYDPTLLHGTVLAEEVLAGLCGHKGVGGKSCTRPKDHPEKNHRYK